MTEQTIEETSPQLPAISIVMAAHDHERELEQHLPILMEQDYPAGFEVIVVVSKGEDNTDDVLKYFSAKYKHLYTTFIPDSSRYMSRKKLAITLGVKAAKNEWIMMTEAHSIPASKNWLREMAKNCDEDRNLVIGYSNYEDESSDYQRFERLYFQRYLLRESQRRTTYRCDSTNMMFRKSHFLEGRGFEGNLKYLRGEYDFIANKYASPLSTAVELAQDAWTIEDAPSAKSWKNKHLFYLETRQHLKRSFRHRLIFFNDMLALHLNWICILAGIIISTILLILDSMNVNGWIIAAATLIALIISITLRMIFAKKGVAQFSEEIPTWKLLPYEISICWHQLYYKFKYKMADQYDFISHKI